MVTKSLTVRAAKWYQAYKNLSLLWDKFKNEINQHFAGVSALNKLHIKLYSTKQEEKEAVGIFLQKKYLLALRLLPQATDQQVVSLLLDALKPSIKKVLRAATISSFQELIERAVQAESDEVEENPRKVTRKTTNGKTTAAAQQQNNNQADFVHNTHPLRQCHYCPGQH
ncbi:activity-regulated cytoskeleton associated protein 1-like [Belonocnema kinseyi]|uniref:activity-regulated cytoskeleton associated protein 1-like n=1 Tax=Belonocnema kinseyi TaxID=2817044 RepID=UPI00143CD69B|nr:activity-regulated cytoskeleton associated protein 1-like [Belonocnema kinseyi]